MVSRACCGLDKFWLNVGIGSVVGNFSGPKQQEIVTAKGHTIELLRPDDTGKIFNVAHLLAHKRWFRRTAHHSVCHSFIRGC